MFLELEKLAKQSYPIERPVGCYITISKVPFFQRRYKNCIRCYVSRKLNDCGTAQTIPFTWFKQNGMSLSDIEKLDTFTQRIYNTQNDIDLYQLLAGKVLRVTGKLSNSQGHKVPNLKYVKDW